MQTTRKTHLTGIVLTIASITVAAAAVYAADTLPELASLGKAHAASPVVTTKAPLPSTDRATEVWSADESAAGTRPDAAH